MKIRDFFYIFLQYNLQHEIFRDVLEQYLNCILTFFRFIMDPIDAINRYFYLQTTKHEFTNSIDFEESLIGVNVYEHLLRSVEAYDAMSGIDLAKRAIQSKTLSRKDEVFRVLAFFLKKIDSSHTKPEITAAKHEIYESLPDMFESDTDMLLFIRNYNNKGKCYRKFFQMLG